MDARHMDRVLRHAILEGLPPMTAIQMMTINTAEHFGLTREMGMIAPGRWADIVFTRDLKNFRAELVVARGQVIAQYRIARAQQEEASLAFQQTLLNAGSEVNDALTAWQTSLSKSELLDKQVASLQTAARSTSLLMEHGNTTYLEVLTARQTLLNAQLAQTANRFSEIQSLINLYKALGGGQE